MVEVRSAGAKGMGAFAGEPIAAGAWVGGYAGTLSTMAEIEARYDGDFAPYDYIFTVCPDRGLHIDPWHSTHFSRFINHAEHPNLRVDTDSERLRIDFFAMRDIATGEELSFDCIAAATEPMGGVE